MAHKRVKLRSSNGEVFEVDEAVAFKSQLLKNMLKDLDTDTNTNFYSTVPLPNVHSSILAKVIEYCKYHVENQNQYQKAIYEDVQATSKKEEEIKAWDADFVNVDDKTLFELIMAANYMDATSLFDLLCQTIADKVKMKTVEEFREIFGIENNFTPEEEAQVRRENQWAFPSSIL